MRNNTWRWHQGLQCAPDEQGGGGEHKPDEPFDLYFINHMIPHHEEAITISRVALDRAEHPEIREIAQKIVETQEAEIQRLKELRKTWYE